MPADERLSYRPLHIDPVIEARVQRRDYERALGFRGLPERFSRWLQSKLPFGAYAPPLDHGYSSIDRQMVARTEFPTAAWSNFPRPLADVLPVLELMRDDLDWPNHHFLPDDPLPLVLTNNDELSGAWFFTGVSLRFKVDYADHELQKMYHENCMVGQLALDILKRLPPPEPPPEPKRRFWRRLARK